MKFWDKMTKKQSEEDAAPEMTALEKRLAEKAAQESDEGADENAGPETLTEAQEAIAELNERIVRLTADFDNFRKRAQREKDEARQFANQGLLEKLLPVLDNFEMALTAVKDADPSVRDGVQMILDQLLGVLKESGVEPVDEMAFWIHAGMMWIGVMVLGLGAVLMHNK